MNEHATPADQAEHQPAAHPAPEAETVREEVTESSAPAQPLSESTPQPEVVAESAGTEPQVETAPHAEPQAEAPAESAPQAEVPAEIAPHAEPQAEIPPRAEVAPQADVAPQTQSHTELPGEVANTAPEAQPGPLPSETPADATLAEQIAAAVGEADVTQDAPAAAAIPETQKPAAVAPSPVNEERRRRAQEAWDRIVQSKESGDPVQGYVKSAVKGGLLVEIDGYRGFLPASQAGTSKGAPLEPLVKTTIPLKILDVDQARKRVVVSHRRALQDERRVARTELLRSLKVGEEREATVMRLADFGAFVDLGGVDALIPASELAFERVDKPSDVVRPGEKLKVRVLRIENGGKKIAVSRKAALPDPWRDHAEVLRNGYVTEGKVVAKEPRLQVEIAPGIVGSLGDRDADPQDYEIGETVEVSVRSVDYRNRRIRLSTLHSAASFSPTGFAPLGVELKR
ncbi:MAG TPA: S1 RNA-binding domain-containing protein [Candidatus Baltobacteraceae bacterium]|nr:S1 RNA-binding domain-containing protein [Candidatus Baltobacteraceae bacterium]